MMKNKPSSPPLPPPPLLLLAAAALAFFAAAAAAQPPPSPAAAPFRSPADAVASRPDLSLLVMAVQAAGLTEQFSSPDLPTTIFAPTNAALQSAASSLGVDPAGFLTSNRTLLFDILRFHVVPGSPPRTLDRLREARSPQLLTLLPGSEPLEVRISQNGSILVGGGLGPTAMVIDGDIRAGQSVLHVIDEVKVPGAVIDRIMPAAGPAAGPAPPPPPAASSGA